MKSIKRKVNQNHLGKKMSFIQLPPEILSALRNVVNKHKQVMVLNQENYKISA